MALEQVFVSPVRIEDLRSSPLGGCIEDFCDWLLSSGFSRSTVRRHLSNVSHLGKYLGSQTVGCPETITGEVVEDFFKAYRSKSRNRPCSENHLRCIRSSAARFAEFLGQNGQFIMSEKETPPYQPLMDGYLKWIREHQYAGESTLKSCRRNIERFLESLAENATPEGLSRLTTERIESFFLNDASEMGRSSRKAMQSALRAFLRFCSYEGCVPQGLEHAVPSLRTYKLARVPHGLDHVQAQAVVDSVDRGTHVGRRNYAILMLLDTYGVRAGQVCALQLNDIHWSQDQILFKATKGGKDSLLPLTPQVGESLLDYLRSSRPRRAFSEVFLTCRAPYRPMAGPGTVTAIVSKHVLRAGIQVVPKGARTFRHALATRMVGDGHPLKAVADVLGHRLLSTTFLYTKVDFPALSQVGLEWPEEVAS